MKWQYLVEEIPASADKETIEGRLSELDTWEAVTSWAVPGDPHTNKGEWIVHILFKKPK